MGKAEDHTLLRAGLLLQNRWAVGPPGHGSQDKSCPATQPPVNAYLNYFIKRGWCSVSAQEISTKRLREEKQEAEP